MSRIFSGLTHIITPAIVLSFICILAGSSAAQTCDPPCRSGYLCKDGTCQSACNPPCPDNQKCDPVKQDCIPLVPQSESTETGPSTAVGVGFATGSGIFGLAMTPIIVGLGIASAATSDELLPSLPLGASALGVEILTVPVSSIGGSIARRNNEVRGVLALRITSWVAYGYTVASGAIMVGMGANEAQPPMPLILTSCIVAGISTLTMSIDNLVCASQANRRRASTKAQALGPSLSLMISPYQGDGAAMRIGLRF